jgi:hypothetical protein
VLQLLDVLFTILHTAIVFANVLLWIPRRTRRWHLGIVALTAFSWCLLGPVFGHGLGYCVLTDWHWDIKRARGEQGLPSSFITYLFGLVGVDAARWANSVTLATFATVASLSGALNLRDFLKAKRQAR